MDFASSVPDFRRSGKGNIRHRLGDSIMLLILGRACGCVGRADIIELGRHNLNKFRNEDDVVFAEAAAPVVHAAATLLQGDVLLLGNEELGIIALGGLGWDDAAGDVAGVGIFEEAAVWAALAGSFTAVVVIDEDFHSWSCVWFYIFKLHKISEKKQGIKSLILLIILSIQTELKQR